MSFRELVIPDIKPDLVEEALRLLPIAAEPFSNLPGLITRRVAHVIRHDGQDVSSQHLPILQMQWEQPENFYACVSTPIFADFIAQIGPLLASKPAPQLFTPSPEYASGGFDTESRAELFFNGDVAGKKAEVDSAWESLVSVLKKEGGEVSHWSGWGIDASEGKWAGHLGFKGTKELNHVTSKAPLAEALAVLKSVSGLEEFVVEFVDCGRVG